MNALIAFLTGNPRRARVTFCRDLTHILYLTDGVLSCACTARKASHT